MITATTSIEFLFSITLFINACLFIPQVIKIYQEKKATQISSATFSGFLLIQFIMVLYSIIIQDKILLSSSLLSMLTCGAVVILTFIYRQRKKTDLDADVAIEAILQQLSGHVFWKNKEGVYLGHNTKDWRVFGLKSMADFIGKTDYDLFAKADADNLRIVDQEVMRTGELKIAEEEITIAGGEKKLYLSHKVPLKNSHNQIVGVLGISIDITHAKQKITDRLEILDNIIAVMPGHVYWLNKEGIYLGCNDNQAKALGFNSRKEIIGKNNSEIGSFFTPQVLDFTNKTVMETGKKLIAEESIRLPDGTTAIFLSNKVPLRNSFHQIIGMVSVSIDITDRKKAEHEIEIAKEAAEAANQAKTQFLFNMRHDLKTPFSGILGIAEFLENSEQDEKKKENLSYITQAAQALLDHLNEIFEFTLVETGQLPLLEKQFDLHKLLLDTYRIHAPSAKDKGIHLEVNIDENLPQYVIGDPIRTQRILINLISNSIKFTDKGFVKFYATLGKQSAQKDIVKFAVEDSGVGIPEDKQNIIFENFKQTTTPLNGFYPRNGLGLRMIKHFIDEMGGEIHLHSEIGKGSEFKVLIPYKKTLLAYPEEQL